MTLAAAWLDQGLVDSCQGRLRVICKDAVQPWLMGREGGLVGGRADHVMRRHDEDRASCSYQADSSAVLAGSPVLCPAPGYSADFSDSCPQYASMPHLNACTAACSDQQHARSS